VSGLPEVNRFLLAGRCARLDAKSFFSAQFSETEVAYMVPGFLDPEATEETPEDISGFAIPIALAWKTLDGTNPLFYPTNLLPKTIRDRQKVYKVAWHGLILITLVCSSALFLLWQWKGQQTRITEAENSLARTEMLIQGSESELERLGNLERLRSRVVELERQNAMMDSLGSGAKRWSPTLESMVRHARSLNSLWFESMTADKEDRVSLSGWSLYRNRIPRIANLLGATVSKVSSDQIRGQAVYRFVLTIPLPD
ncbi:MAG: hypothetical protein V1800_18975, partial [Candidatus Latescibacterota bacterium]